MTRVAVLDDYQGKAHTFAEWGSLGADVETTFFHNPMTEGELVESLGRYDVIVLMRERTRFPRRVLEQLGDLRLVVTTGAGNASVDLAYLNERGIVMCGTQTGRREGGAGGVGGPVEIAFALIFATVKRLVIEDRAIRAGSWQLGFPGELAGMTLGLAGLGRLGAVMVAPARMFGMNVIAWSQNLTEARAQEVGVERVAKDELLGESDVLSIHLVLSDRSRGLFGARDLALMKPSAILINTSRGPIVDEQALIDALRTGQIAGAGLDVFDAEPLPRDHPLVSLENTVLAPHLGYVSEEGFRGMYAQAVEDIAAFLNGQPIRVVS